MITQEIVLDSLSEAKCIPTAGERRVELDADLRQAKGLFSARAAAGGKGTLVRNYSQELGKPQFYSSFIIHNNDYSSVTNTAHKHC